jgi:hypothetical protein
LEVTVVVDLNVEVGIQNKEKRAFAAVFKSFESLDVLQTPLSCLLTFIRPSETHGKVVVGRILRNT